MKIKKINTLAVAAFAIALTPGVQSASAQSFSCARAAIPSELAICNDEDLLIMDEKVAALFAEKRVSATSGKEAIRLADDHGSWLRKRNICENNSDCLKAVYDKRIRTLDKNL